MSIEQRKRRATWRAAVFPETLSYGFALVAACGALGMAGKAWSQETTLVAGFHENTTVSQNSLDIFGAAGTAGTISNNAGFSLDFSIGAEGFFRSISTISIRSSR